LTPKLAAIADIFGRQGKENGKEQERRGDGGSEGEREE